MTATTQETTPAAWKDDLLAGFGSAGVCAVAFWAGAIAAREIRETQSTFPLFMITGAQGTGKSTLLEFLWRLYGIPDYEGIAPLHATTNALIKALAGDDRKPAVFVTVDRPTKWTPNSFTWDELKPCYAGDRIAERGTKYSDEVTDVAASAGVVFTPDNEADISPALAERSCRVDLDRICRDDPASSAAAAYRLVLWPVDDAREFGRKIAACAPAIADHLAANADARAYGLQRSGIKSDRLATNYGQLMALIEAIGPAVADVLDTCVGDSATQFAAHLAHQHQRGA